MSLSASFGLMLIRGMVGCVMFLHGAQKLFGWFGGAGMEGLISGVAGWNLPGGIPPAALAYAAAISEFAGGILLMLGLGTRVAAVFVAATMAVAAFKAHPGEFPGKMEFPLTLCVIAVGLFFTGPGRLALDNLFARRRAAAPKAEKK